MYMFTCTSLIQCSAIVRWIDGTVMRLAPHGYEQAYGIWNGEDFLPVLEKELSLTVMSVSIYEVGTL